MDKTRGASLNGILMRDSRCVKKIRVGSNGACLELQPLAPRGSIPEACVCVARSPLPSRIDREREREGERESS